MSQGLLREIAILRVFHCRFWRQSMFYGCLAPIFRDFTLLRNVIFAQGTASMAVHARGGHFEQAAELFGSETDDRAYVAALKACAIRGDLARGKVIHAQILESGFQSNVHVCNSLIHMYAKCGCLEDARKVFDGLVARDLVSWNAMIAGYAQLATGKQALHLFQQMEDEGLRADKVTFLSVLKACQNVDDVKQVHAKFSDSGYEFERQVGNSLISVYARCGSCQEARRVFDRLPDRDVVSWNAMIAGYVSAGQADDAVWMFWQMQEAGLQPDKVTLISSLKACSRLAALDQGKLVHAFVTAGGFESEDMLRRAIMRHQSDSMSRCR